MSKTLTGPHNNYMNGIHSDTKCSKAKQKSQKAYETNSQIWLCQRQYHDHLKMQLVQMEPQWSFLLQCLDWSFHSHLPMSTQSTANLRGTCREYTEVKFPRELSCTCHLLQSLQSFPVWGSISPGIPGLSRCLNYIISQSLRLLPICRMGMDLNC